MPKGSLNSKSDHCLSVQDAISYICCSMKPIPSIEELEDPAAWEKVLTLPYGGIAPFVISNLTRPALPIVMIWFTAAASLFLSVWFWPGVKYESADPRIITGLASGLLLIPLLLIPVHEGAHLIPFRIAGAKDIRFGADLKQGIVWVTAHRFVAGKKLFRLVALTPFVIISITILIFILLSPLWWKWVLSMTLLVHTTMCAGDAALLGFMNSLGTKRVCTWDDADLKEAYFYVSTRKADN